MGKAWKTASIFGGLAVSTFIAYTQTSPETWYNSPLLILSLVAATGFAIAGILYLVIFIKFRLCPLDILEDIRCTYWSNAKQVRVVLWWCDYSNASKFNVSCLVQFGSQAVKLTDKINLDDIYIGNSYCRGGRKRMAEFRKNDVEVKDSSQCLVTISMKPQGIWATRKKSKELATSVVNN